MASRDIVILGLGSFLVLFYTMMGPFGGSDYLLEDEEFDWEEDDLRPEAQFPEPDDIESVNVNVSDFIVEESENVEVVDDTLRWTGENDQGMAVYDVSIFDTVDVVSTPGPVDPQMTCGVQYGLDEDVPGFDLCDNTTVITEDTDRLYIFIDDTESEVKQLTGFVGTDTGFFDFQILASIRAYFSAGFSFLENLFDLTRALPLWIEIPIWLLLSMWIISIFTLFN